MHGISGLNCWNGRKWHGRELARLDGRSLRRLRFSSGRAAPVEIGRLDEEQPTFRVFSRNPPKHIVVEIVGNGLVERSQIRQSSVGERSCGGQNVSYRRRDHQYHLRPIGDGRPGLIRES